MLYKLLCGHINSSYKFDIIKTLQSNHIFNSIHEQAQMNTKIFSKLLRMIPDNQITNLAQFRIFTIIKTDSSNSKEEIKGSILIYPYKFLSNKLLVTTIISKEVLISNILYE